MDIANEGSDKNEGFHNKIPWL